jgi:DNA repair protein RecN (Recombination protein N)
VSKELHGLAMPTGKFHCNVTSANGESISDFGPNGVDEVSMVFTAHGGELLPINKAASGGELSRLMLAIEVVVAGVHPKETYIFDEIDAGVGGKAALEVGKRLRALSKGSQVIVVTHLPQVALWADHHLLVRKESGAITQSAISLVDGRSREVEIARMLSGVESSEHAQEHARELLDLRNLEVG